MVPELLRSLQDLGFTEYEAKAYLALLDDSPLSGYGVARNSGVPRSKIYEVLGGLVKRGEILVNHGEPVRYAPLPPKELISRRRREMEDSIGTAEQNLERYATNAADRGVIWDLTGREEILDRAREMAGRAQRSILAEIWQEDAPELREALAAAADRGVEVGVVSYGEPAYPFARVYHHEPGPEEITREFGGRWIIVSIDMREIVTGIISMGRESRAAWTSHPGLVVPTTELIKHDIYVKEMLDEHRGALEESFGPALSNLRERLKRLEATDKLTKSS